MSTRRQKSDGKLGNVRRARMRGGRSDERKKRKGQVYRGQGNKLERAHWHAQVARKQPVDESTGVTYSDRGDKKREKHVQLYAKATNKSAHSGHTAGKWQLRRRTPRRGDVGLHKTNLP